MRIFQVCADHGIPPRGTKGASVHFRSLAGALAARGHEVISFSAAAPGGEQSFPVPLEAFSSVEDLFRLERSSGIPDVIYERYSLPRTSSFPAPGSALSVARAARRMGCMHVLEVNAPLLTEAARIWGRSVTESDVRDEAALFREADLVVTVSTPLAGYVGNIRGTGKPTVVIPNGFDPALFPEPTVHKAGNRKLVFLGTPRPWHGLEQFCRVLDLLRGRRVGASLTIIGADSHHPRMAPLWDAARSGGVENMIHMTGPLPHREAAGRLLEAAVAVAPFATEEPFYFCPVKIFEYMAAGLPVVTTPQGDLPEILGGVAELVPPGNDEAFADAVEHLLDKPELRSERGRAARLRAFENFTWTAAAERLEAAISRTGSDIFSIFRWGNIGLQTDAEKSRGIH